MSHGTLRLERKSPKDIKIRGLEILIDEKIHFNLNYGQERDVDLEPGDHVFKASNGLFSVTTPFVVSVDTVVRYDASNFAGTVAKFIFLLIGMGPYRVVVTRLD